MMERSSCPACLGPMSNGYSRLRWEMDREAKEGVFSGSQAVYQVCILCGLIGKYPQPPESELRHYYEHAWQYSEPRPGYDLAAKAIVRGIIRQDGAGIFPLKAPGSERIGDATVLDVGSKGDKLTEALQKEGLLVTSAGGIDPKPREGVEPAWLGRGLAEPRNHSIVSATHVLEHVLSPHLFLSDLANLTAEGGYVYIEVPSLRGGLRDVGYCDDINRNHLWHFGLHALMNLGSIIGTVTLLETDTSLPGWPVDRMVVKKCRPTESLEVFSIVARDIDSEYSKASEMIRSESPANVGLYGASHSWARLLEVEPSLAAYRVYDRHKAGMSYKTSRGKELKIRDPDMAAELGSRKVWVTTRSWNSYIDIKRWLNLNRPELLVRTPYMALAKALKEGEFAEAIV